MERLIKRKTLMLVCGWLALCAGQTPAAISVGPFGPHGEGGSKNGQQFLIGAGSSVFELDAFLQVGGLDLNGPLLGTSAQLSRDRLPAGLAYSFSPALSLDQESLVLTYALSNSTATVFSNVRFFVMLDAEIDETTNTFFDEYATVKGTPGHGIADGSPDQWQVDEPGFTTGTLFRNLFLGNLSNSNSVPQSAPNDVAMALGFSLGNLSPGSAAALRVMISENGNSLGSLALVHRDIDPASPTFITFSGGLAPALSGAVFVDANNNGLLDAGEGLANVTLLVLTNGVSAAPQPVTDSDGRYSFNALPAGTYQVQLETAALPPGLALLPGTVSGATTNPATITLVGGVSETLNWGYGHPALTGQVFVDANTNAIFDAGDQPLANVSVLLTSNGAGVGRSVTDSNGLYAFGNLAAPNPSPGSYNVIVDRSTLPPGILLAPAVPLAPPTNTWTVTLKAGSANRLDWLVYYQGGLAAPPQFRFLAWTLNRASGSLLGRLELSNTNGPGTGPAPEPFQLGLHPSAKFSYPRPDGTNGLPYLDLTSAVRAASMTQLGQATLNPGQVIVLTNAVEVYSSTRTAPADSQFDWVPLRGP